MTAVALASLLRPSNTIFQGGKTGLTSPRKSPNAGKTPTKSLEAPSAGGATQKPSKQRGVSRIRPALSHAPLENRSQAPDASRLYRTLPQRRVSCGQVSGSARATAPEKVDGVPEKPCRSWTLSSRCFATKWRVSQGEGEHPKLVLRRFTEIEVERINVVEAGRAATRLSHRELAEATRSHPQRGRTRQESVGWTHRLSRNDLRRPWDAQAPASRTGASGPRVDRPSEVLRAWLSAQTARARPCTPRRSTRRAAAASPSAWARGAQRPGLTLSLAPRWGAAQGADCRATAAAPRPASGSRSTAAQAPRRPPQPPRGPPPGRMLSPG